MPHSSSPPSCVGIVASPDRITVLVTETGQRTDTLFSTFVEANQFAQDERERLKAVRATK